MDVTTSSKDWSVGKSNLDRRSAEKGKDGGDQGIGATFF